MTPLLGREFDLFLFALIGDEQDGPPLSVVSALARLEVDPWTEAACLTRMPRDQAKQRLASLLASLPNCTAGSSPEVVAARLIALLPQAGSVNAAAAARLRRVPPIPHSRLLIGLGVLALLPVGYFMVAARASNAPEGTAESLPCDRTDQRPAWSHPWADYKGKSID
jgi:hypothetical protein